MTFLRHNAHSFSLAQFPWSDTSIYSPGDVDNLFECTSRAWRASSASRKIGAHALAFTEAISIAMSNSDVEASYHTLAQQLVSTLKESPVPLD